MSSIISSNMSLVIPSVGSEPGPDYAFDVNASLTLIDNHDHSPGRGVQITPAGLNINAALTLNSNNLVSVGTIIFDTSTSVSSLQSLYVKVGAESPTTNDLFFNDGNGNEIQITSGGAVNATIASIPGQSYAGGTFFWKQGAGSTTPANFDIGGITLRPTTAGTTYGITLTPPVGIASAYGIQLPALPASQSFMTIDNSGNILAPITFAGGITTSNISPTAGIVGTQLADNTITLQQLANSVLQWNVATITTSQTWTRPASDITTVFILACGGGAGGGGGGGDNGAQSGGGGSGGMGSLPQFVPMNIVNDLTITIGTGGSGGNGGSSGGGNGGPGNAGGDTIVTDGTTSITFRGAPGGNTGGRGTTAGGSGGTALSFNAYWQSAAGSGGPGGSGSGATAGSPGQDTIYATGGSAGSAASGVGGGGGGGGGGASLGAGGNGGQGGNSPAAGQDAGIGAGGGGGGGKGPTNGSASIGGDGGDGIVYIFWLGEP